MDFIINWLIHRMGYVYNFVVNTLHLPSQVGYIVLGALVIIFFYDLYDIYTQRNKDKQALIWLAVLLIIPLGTVLYLLVGRRMLHSTPIPIKPTYVQPVRPISVLMGSGTRTKKATTTLGTVIAVIAWIVGAAALCFFVFIVIALIQCSNDPKCM